MIHLPSQKDSNIDENENKAVQVKDKSSNGSKDTNSNEENSEDGTSEKKDTSVANEEKTTWEEMTLVNEIEDIIPATQTEIKKVKNTIESQNLSTTEIENWKNNNWEKYDTILDQCQKREYEVMKVLVQCILDDREQKKMNETECSVIANVIGLSKEVEKSTNLTVLASIPEENESMETDDESNRDKNSARTQVLNHEKEQK